MEFQSPLGIFSSLEDGINDVGLGLRISAEKMLSIPTETKT